MRKPILCGAVLLTLGLSLGEVEAKEKAMIISWGDVIEGPHTGVARLDTVDKVRQATRTWKSKGVQKVLFRADNFRVLLFHQHLVTRPGHEELWSKTRSAWDSGLLEAAVKAMKEVGIEPFVWLTILDEGCPPTVLYSDSHPFPWQSHFTRENPRFLSCDRSLSENARKYHWGFLEYAYPEVRRYMLKVIRAFSDGFGFDGVFLSLRSHAPPPDHADQFGFNQPVVQEFKRRYGRDILRQSFDLEKWRELRGDFLTGFLREVKTHLEKQGQKLSIGVQQGEHLGPPFGNMRLQWRRWVEEGIIDELVVGHITQVRARYPHRTQREMGYLQSQEDNVGLPPIEEALREEYGPLCSKNGVKLYLSPGRFNMTFSHPAYGRGRQSPEVRARLLEAAEQIPGVTGVLHGYGSVIKADQE